MKSLISGHCPPRARFSVPLFLAALLATAACRETTAPPPATSLAFVTAPTAATAGSPIPAVVVAIQDANGNTVRGSTQSVTLSTQSTPEGGTLLGTRTVAAVNGIATFADLHIDVANDNQRLYATAPALASAVSAPFVVEPGPATRLAFIVQPVTARRNLSLAPVSIAVLDAFANIVSKGSNTITITLSQSSGAAQLGGTTTMATVQGVATFSDLRVSEVGDSYELVARADNLDPVGSSRFSVVLPPSFTVVAAGYFHTCALSTTGRAWCWGSNVSGQLGISGPGQGEQLRPLAAAGEHVLTTLTAGRDHTCAVAAEAVAYCWGSNANGMLGTGAQALIPTAVTGGQPFSSAIAGYQHSCGVTPGNVGYCWGFNGFGELGDGTNDSRSSPAIVSGGLAFVSISSGRLFTCGVTTTGGGYCWGVNESGELGDGTLISRNRPAPVSGQLEFAMISAGGFHACGLTTSGSAYCWGTNSTGALGTESSSISSVPVAVAGGLRFGIISAGNRHTCAVTTDGVGYCWGEAGMIGDGASVTRRVPTRVSGGLSFASVSAGRFHSCGVTTDGIVYCWGLNGTGQLGNGTKTPSLVPVVAEPQ